MSSDDDIVAGRVTTAESTTDILGAVPSGDDHADFNGVVILRVAPQPGDLSPQITIDGIHGVGHSEEGGLVVSPGGTGVVGFGGPNQGTGIAGLGGGLFGRGGIGVRGTGGSVPHFSGFGPKHFPGAGVVGQGGREEPTSTSEFQSFSYGAGVIAVAGGSGKPIPPQTGGVGVYVQGAEANVFPEPDSGPIIAPGPGVLGRGGLPIPREGPVAAGVIGLAGDTAIPSISESGDCGVYGAGPVGVFGHGTKFGVGGNSTEGVGVAGASDKGNGGYFESKEVAQIHLEPHQPSLNDPNGHIEGRAGDLLAVAGDQVGRASLYFCRKTGNMGWVQLAV